MLIQQIVFAKAVVSLCSNIIVVVSNIAHMDIMQMPWETVSSQPAVILELMEIIQQLNVSLLALQDLTLTQHLDSA